MWAVLHNLRGETISNDPNLPRLAVQKITVEPILPWVDARVSVTPLQAAAYFGNRSHLIEAMLEAGAVVDDASICLARRGDHSGLEAELTERSSQVRASDPLGQSLPALCRLTPAADRALRHGGLGLVRTFEETGTANPAFEIMAGTPQMHLAAGNRRQVETALAHGWNPGGLQKFVGPAGEFPHLIPAILIPVLLDDTSFVEMLASGGIEPDDPGLPIARCAATRRDRENALRILSELSENAPAVCGEEEPDWVRALDAVLRDIRGQFH